MVAEAVVAAETDGVAAMAEAVVAAETDGVAVAAVAAAAAATAGETDHRLWWRKDGWGNSWVK